MMKNEFIKKLQEYIDETIYITTSFDEIEKEIDHNCWWISGSVEQIQSLSLNEWEDYIHKLIADRVNQLNASKVSVNLIFYCWYDEFAGQLRFNVINSNHKRLPFGCNYKPVPLEGVIRPFINDSNPGTISEDELEELNIDGGIGDDREYILKVYIHHINQSKKNV